MTDEHEDWCPAKVHADCCGKDCSCLHLEIVRLRDALTDALARERANDSHRSDSRKGLASG
jgi:hypothetical protein